MDFAEKQAIKLQNTPIDTPLYLEYTKKVEMQLMILQLLRHKEQAGCLQNSCLVQGNRPPGVSNCFFAGKGKQ